MIIGNAVSDIQENVAVNEGTADQVGPSELSVPGTHFDRQPHTHYR